MVCAGEAWESLRCRATQGAIALDPFGAAKVLVCHKHLASSASHVSWQLFLISKLEFDFLGCLKYGQGTWSGAPQDAVRGVP